ncbi:MAG: ABC transporter permease [Deltaproteobacteria bacterium]|nr:ABC transporter permease [Deltaproteobacteria bacterium]
MIEPAYLGWTREAVRVITGPGLPWVWVACSAVAAGILLVLIRPRRHDLAFAWRVALSHLRARRQRHGISAIALVSVVGVIVGVMALVIVLSVMAGFEADMREKILGSNAHIVVLPYGGTLHDPIQVVEEIQQVPGVTAAAPFLYTEMMLRSRYASAGVVLKGFDPVLTPFATDLLENLTVGPEGGLEDMDTKRALLARISSPPRALGQDEADNEDVPGVILGSELADSLHVYPGDKIHVINPVGTGESGPFGMPIPKVLAVRVAGLFYTGMFEYDAKWCYISNDDLRGFLGLPPGSVHGLEVRVADPYAAGEIALDIESRLAYPYYTRHWKNMNQKLFSALKLEKIVMGLILSLIVLVAGLNIVGSLVLVVLTRGREIAILRAMGASAPAVALTFMLEGVVIGVVGTLVGTLLGLLGCLGLDRYRFPLDIDVYYLDSLPVVVEPATVLLVMYTAMFTCFVATLYPARRAARLDPVEGLRYE